MAVSVTRTVIAAYKSVRTNQRQHSGRFSKKKRHIDIKPSFRAPQLSLVWNRDYSLIKNTDKTERLFSVNTLRGRIKCPFRADSMDWAFDEGAVYGTAKLIFRHGKFFLYVPVTINVPDTPAPSSCKKVVGIDRGICFLAAACDGKKTSFYIRRSGQTETGPLQRTPPSAPETADVLRETQDPRHRAERKPLDERCEPSYL
jgi:transposase